MIWEGIIMIIVLKIMSLLCYVDWQRFTCLFPNIGVYLTCEELFIVV